MFTKLKQWLAVGTALRLAFALTVTAYASMPVITHDFDQHSNGNFEINYCLNQSAKVTAGIYRAEGQYSSKIVTLFDTNDHKNAGCYSANWDQTNGKYSEIGTNGSKVASGQYFYGIKADDAYVSSWITVGGSNSDSPGSNDLKFVDLEVHERTFDPQDGQKAQINLTTNKASYIDVMIFDQNQKLVKELYNYPYFAAGTHKLEWNGRNYYNDFVPAGEYSYHITAPSGSGYREASGKLFVESGVFSNSTEDPRLRDVFVTKPEFDPGRNELTHIVFNLTAEADVKVEIYDRHGDYLETIFNKKNRQPGMHVVAWEGDSVVGKADRYQYQITATNTAGSATANGDIHTAEDYKDSKKPNIYKDQLEDLPFEPQFNELFFRFTIDRDADVTIEIREDGDVIAIVTKEQFLKEGLHKIAWNGRNLSGSFVENGIYEYKIIAENYSGKDVEKGFLSVTNTGKAKHFYAGCGAFSDIDQNYKYCQAITWAETSGVFNGYSDGTFRPNQAITRVEALKVISEAMQIRTAEAYGANLGFIDLNPYAWYMPYLNSAVQLGIVNGYTDGTFRPANNVTRAEALKMVLTAGEAKYDIYVPNLTSKQPYYDVQKNDWFLKYASFAHQKHLTDNQDYLRPKDAITRGEMADMLYRYQKNVVK